MVEKDISERNIFGRYIPVAFGLGILAAITIPLYAATSARRAQDEFFQKPVATIEAKVLGERYVQPTNCPSQYFFSFEDPIGRRGTVEVIDANGVGISVGIESPITKESVDARVDIGTRVKVKAREVGPLEYKAFAHEITDDRRGE